MSNADDTQSALIAALLNAPAADRGLDALIALEIDPKRFKHLQLTADSDLRALANVYGIERYTASLDAALTLAPKNSAIGLTDNPDDFKGRYRATVIPPLPAQRGSDQTIYHPSLPIALCIAALKSRDSNRRDTGRMSGD